MIDRLRAAFWRLLDLLTITGTSSAEFQSSTTWLLLSLFMFLPGTNLEPNIPFQRELLSILTEFGWGLLFFGIGAAQSIANLKRFSQGRVVCAFLSASIAGYLTIVAFRVAPISLFLPIFAAVGISQSLCFLVMSLARHKTVNNAHA